MASLGNTRRTPTGISNRDLGQGLRVDGGKDGHVNLTSPMEEYVPETGRRAPLKAYSRKGDKRSRETVVQGVNTQWWKNKKGDNDETDDEGDGGDGPSGLPSIRVPTINLPKNEDGKMLSSSRRGSGASNASSVRSFVGKSKDKTKSPKHSKSKSQSGDRDSPKSQSGSKTKDGKRPKSPPQEAFEKIKVMNALGHTKVHKESGGLDLPPIDGKVRRGSTQGKSAGKDGARRASIDKGKKGKVKTAAESAKDGGVGDKSPRQDSKADAAKKEVEEKKEPEPVQMVDAKGNHIIEEPGVVDEATGM